MAEIFTETKKQIIKEFVELHKCGFIDISDSESIDKIHKLIIKEEVALTTKPIECLYFGWFYQTVKKDYVKMKFYYNLGIEQKESYSMINMSHYYRDIKKDEAKYIKYSQMAVDNGCVVAMRDVAKYCLGGKQYNSVIMYYEMAIELGDTIAMMELGMYYKNNGDYEMMKLYWGMIIEHSIEHPIEDSKDSIVIMLEFACFYHDEKEFDLMKKYLIMAIELGNDKAMCWLGQYYYKTEKDYNLAKKYYLMAIDYNNVQAMINLAYHFRHIERNYEEAKRFLSMACMVKSSAAMIDIGHLYQYIYNDIEKAITYYRMAIDNQDNQDNQDDKDNIKAMRLLGQYFQGEKDYDNMKLYFDMAINKDDCTSSYPNTVIDIKYQCVNDLICHYTNIVKDSDKVNEYREKLDKISESKYTSPKMIKYIKNILSSIPGMNVTYSGQTESKTESKVEPRVEPRTAPYYMENLLGGMLYGGRYSNRYNKPGNIIRGYNSDDIYGNIFDKSYIFW